MKYSVPQQDEWYLNELKQELRQGQDYDKLDNRACYILCHYFGLDDKKPMSLAELGKEFHVTRSRVAQIRDRALHSFHRKSSARYFWRHFAIRFLDERRKELKQ